MSRASKVLLALAFGTMGAAVRADVILVSSAYSPGASGTFFVSDVQVSNPTSVTATMTPVFFNVATGTTVTAPTQSVPGGGQVAWANVLSTLFHQEVGAYGPIRFQTSGALVASINVTSTNACGAVGMAFSGAREDQGIRSGVFPQLSGSTSARTNLIFYNPATATATVKVTIPAGPTTTVTLAGGGFSQILRYGSGAGSFWASFTSDQPVLALATVIDDLSGQAFAVSPVSQSLPTEVTKILPGGVPLVLVRIPAGTFQQGSPPDERGRALDEALHQVTLSEDVYLGRTEVTQAQWQAVMGTPMPSTCGNSGNGPSYPASCVSWNDLVLPGGFLDSLNILFSTRAFRLPTEAEWERAARGGAAVPARFSFGNALDGDDACGASAAADPYLWWCGNAMTTAHPVAARAPGPYDLSDMNGNVQEWVWDWYGPYPSGVVVDPQGPPAASMRVIRGGGWPSGLKDCRSAARQAADPASRNLYVGFRVAMTPN